MNIEKYIDKNGNLLSFRVTVYMGRNSDGKERRIKKTFKIPTRIRPSKYEKYMNEQAVLFEQECKSNASFTSNLTFAQYAERAIEIKKLQGLKTSTLVRYEELLQRINPEIGNIRLDAIKPATLNNFYSKLSKPGTNKRTGEGLSAKTIKEHHNLISTIFEMAVDDELISRNPAAKAKPPKVRKTEAECFTEDELKLILACASQEKTKWRLMLHIFIVTGARRGEVLGLTWREIDFDTGVIHICREILYNSEIGIYEDTPKTAKSERYIKLPALVVDELISYKELQDLEAKRLGDTYTQTDYVFTKEFGGPMHPDSVTDFFRKFSKKHGLPHINPHKFRHSTASLLIFNDIDPVTVSAYLGHSSPTVTTGIYAHAFAKGIAKASDVLGEVLLE